ncbi:MAG: MarR family EPS-associated transcriptional regulator [Gammaproteobacteria bacterium]|nr:MarR family EPS-associated transcriptional regulator [Gammaproteobacteria bacterium]
MTEEIRYKILKILSDNPDVSQRELAESLGISLGKANYCLKALKEKGLVKARNFKNNPVKRGYLYILTPKGIEEKAKVTARFFKRKIEEYELLKEEIEQLRREVISNENVTK